MNCFNPSLMEKTFEVTGPFMNYEVGTTFPIEETTHSEEAPKDLEALRVTPTPLQKFIAAEFSALRVLINVYGGVTFLIFVTQFFIIEFLPLDYFPSIVGAILIAVVFGLVVTYLIVNVVLDPYFRAQMHINGAPFQDSDLVQVIAGRWAGEFAEVIEIRPGGILRLDLQNEKVKKQSDDYLHLSSVILVWRAKSSKSQAAPKAPVLDEAEGNAPVSLSS